MCTLSLYFHTFDDYPLVVAANRDEYYARSSAPPDLLSERPVIFGGRDLEAGGTWLGINQYGLLVGVLNRRLNAADDGSNKRSRGRLCLDVLGAPDPDEALAIVGRDRGSTYRPFNLLIASARASYVAYNLEDAIDVVRLDRGLHVLSNTAVFDPRSEKMDTAYGLFSDVAQIAGGSPREFFGNDLEPRPPCLRSFQAALSSHDSAKGSDDPRGAICVHADPYGTVSSSVIVLAAREKRFHYYHAPGPPCRTQFEKCSYLDVL